MPRVQGFNKKAAGISPPLFLALPNSYRLSASSALVEMW